MQDRWDAGKGGMQEIERQEGGMHDRRKAGKEEGRKGER